MRICLHVTYSNAHTQVYQAGDPVMVRCAGDLHPRQAVVIGQSLDSSSVYVCYLNGAMVKRITRPLRTWLAAEEVCQQARVKLSYEGFLRLTGAS